MQQRPFQLVQCGELLLIDGGEALGFFAERIEGGHNLFLLFQSWEWKPLVLECSKIDVRGGSGNSDSVVSGSLASPAPLRGGRRKERGNEAHETESRSRI